MTPFENWKSRISIDKLVSVIVPKPLIVFEDCFLDSCVVGNPQTLRRLADSHVDVMEVSLRRGAIENRGVQCTDRSGRQPDPMLKGARLGERLGAAESPGHTLTERSQAVPAYSQSEFSALALEER
jgi:hypothetical protein